MPEMRELPLLLVVAGVVVENGCVLVTQRKPGTHLAGTWEFPGGKVEADEDPRDALARELHEELGIVCAVGDVIDVVMHRYEERRVLLLFYAVQRMPGSAEPRALDNAGFQWARSGDLRRLEFPPADRPVLERVRRLLGNSAR